MPISDVIGHVRQGLSRRSFLRGSALATAGATVIGAASAIIGQAEAADSSGLSIIGPEQVPITLKVNGAARTLSVEPRMTLAEALRGLLGLTGTKIACNSGVCSACTVWLDGLPVCSCMMLAIDVGARSVTTIEGLASGNQLHRVQAAFIEHDALQCGFCTPGMVMSCAALLERVPNPSPEDVQAAISGHLCRCGTYPHVVAATLAAAKAQKA
jgi:xanthine dehydrogenase YagT iron-sulfur-binding subunit